MKLNINWKLLGFHSIAIVSFVLLSIMYMSPILEGKKLPQHDIMQAQGMSAEIQSYYKETGELYRWTNSMFSGMPAYRIWGSAVVSEIGKVNKLFQLYLPRPASNLFLYLLGFYILMIAMGVRPLLAVIGSVSFAFASYNIIILEAGHITKSATIAYVPAAMAGVLLVYRGKYLLGGVLAALFLALAVRTNHVQIGYYLAIIIVFYILNQAVFYLKDKGFKRFTIASGVLLASALLAIGVNASNLWTTYEYSKESIRGGSSELAEKKSKTKGGLDTDYAWRWSYSPTETFTLIVPNAKGGASTGSLSESSETYKALTRNRIPPQQAKQFINRLPLYHGDQPFTSGPVYFGAIVCFLFVFALFVLPAKYKYWMLILSLLTIFLSWGRHFESFNQLFFDYLPLYNKFRTPSMTLVITSFLFVWMAMLALRSISDLKNKERLMKALKFSGGISGGLLVLIFIVGSGMDFSGPSDNQFSQGQQWIIDAIEKDRASILRADIFRSFIFIALAAGAIYFYLQKKIKQQVFLGIVGLLILVDLWSVDKRYLDNEDFIQPKQYEQQRSASAADRQIMQDKDPHYRVFNTTGSGGPFNDAMTSYYHKSVGGYHPAKLIRYQDMIERHLSQGNMAVFNMLNTKYFINKGQNNQEVAQRNPGALGNAWFIDDINFVDNADEEIGALNNFDPSSEVYIDKRFKDYVSGFDPEKDASGQIQLTSYLPDHLTYSYNASTEQFVVFSEVYYNDELGWHAYLDGEKVEHIRVNYVLRGMKVPAGQHTIEFKFEPRSYYTGRKIASISFYLLLILLIAGIGLELKRGAKTDQ